jgi:hypothetical protein
MDLKQFFPSWKCDANEFHDLFPRGTVVTIATIEPRTNSDDEEYLTIYFEELKKPISLNKTNAFAIADITGTTETDDWAGVQIKLFAMPVEYNDRTTKKRVTTLGFRVFGKKPNEQPTLAKGSDLTRLLMQTQRQQLTDKPAASQDDQQRMGDKTAVLLMLEVLKRGWTWHEIAAQLVQQPQFAACNSLVLPDWPASTRAPAWALIKTRPVNPDVQLDAQAEEQRLKAIWYPPKKAAKGEVIDPRTGEVLNPTEEVDPNDIPF